MKNKPPSHFVYIVQCADTSLYTGYARDVQKRLLEHNGDAKIAGAKYTHGRRPVVLQYYEEFSTRSDALKREYEIKQLSRKEKEHLISP